MKQNIFGTDGIRGKVGIEPFTIESIIKLGNAIGKWAKQHYAHPGILIGNDTRQSCSLIKSALQTGLMMHDHVQVYDSGIAPTPAIIGHIPKVQIHHIGIIISASHNPYYDNGIKIIDTKGKLSEKDELIITKFFLEKHEEFKYSSFGNALHYPQLIGNYRNLFAYYFSSKFLSGKKIVLDLANGATENVATHIFEDFSAHVININCLANGTNINDQCGALDTRSLQKAVIEHQADIGFAFDGDGDRVIAVNRHGHIKDGDDLLALLMHHPLYKEQKKIVGTVMTNQGFQTYINAQEKELIRVNVGDKYIAQRLEQENLMIGGEQSGHIILRDYLNTGDGIFTAFRVLESIIHTHNWDMVTFAKFPQILINMPVKIKKDLTNPYFAQLIATHEAQLRGGRLLVRYSGTESLLRIMIEDVDVLQAQKIGEHLSQELSKVLCI